eukprot:ANDGO_08627.mRNA.1 Anaphase-promoting complex subunit 10
MTGTTSANALKHLPIQIWPAFRLLEDQRDVTREGVWTVSSSKSGSGIKCLLDDDTTTFWQSDGTQPHMITVHFPRLTSVEDVFLHLDYRVDESYTPSKIAILAGVVPDAVRETNQIELQEPSGWVRVPCVARDDMPLAKKRRRRTASSRRQRQGQGQGQEVGEEEREGTRGRDGGEEEEEGDEGEGGANSDTYSMDELNAIAAERSPVLRCFELSILIVANHQAGRDTHVRAVKVVGPNDDSANRSEHQFPAFQTPEFAQFSTIR